MLRNSQEKIRLKKIWVIVFVLLTGVIVLPLPPQGVSIAEDLSSVQLSRIKGFVQIQKTGEDKWQKATPNMPLSSGDKIRSFLESSAVLLYPDQSEFILGENSSLQIKDISQNPKTKATNREFKLDLGTLHYKVTPLKEKASDLKIYSSTAIVGVTGTEGVIHVEGDDKPTENILIEGTTYNTDEDGQGGLAQKQGDVYNMDDDDVDLYASDAEEEAKALTEMNQELIEALKILEAEYATKKQAGYDVSAVEDILEKAYAHLEQKAYDFVKTLIEEGKEKLEQSEKLPMFDELKEAIDAIRTQIQAKADEGYGVSEVYLLLEKIEQALEGKDKQVIENLLTQITQKFETLPKGDGGFLEDYHAMEALVLEKAQKGFSVDEVKELLRRSFISYESKDFAKAFRLLKEVEDKLQQTSKEVPAYITEKITYIEEELAKKKAEGYQVDAITLQVDELKKLLESESFVKVKQLIQDIEEGLGAAIKKISVEWEVKINDLEKKINYQKAQGLNLGDILDQLVQLMAYKKQSDLENLEKTYTLIKEALKTLSLPEGFETEWQEFVKHFSEKEALGLDVKELKDLKERIQSAIDKGDIHLARSFLEKAKEKLAEIKDSEPPVVQILTFEESEDKIVIDGVVNDNTQVKQVTVNNSLVDVAANGQFGFETVPSAQLEAIVIVAEDMAGNLSPPVTLKPTVVEVDAEQSGEITEAKLEYSDEALIVKGAFVPSGKITISDIESFADSQGAFAVELIIDDDITQNPIIIIGTNSDGTKTQEVSLTVEDKWQPIIKVGDVKFAGNVAPNLAVNSLDYLESSLVVSGKVEVQMMATIEGQVSDIGGEVTVLKIFDRDVHFNEEGRFSTSVTLTAEDVAAKVYVEDQAGNSTEQSIPLDIVTESLVVKVNSVEVLLGSQGEFREEIGFNQDLKEILVDLESSSGELVASEKLPVVMVIPPELQVSSVNYTKDTVEITGNTAPQAKILDKSKSLFDTTYEASGDGVFTIKVARPETTVEAILVAENLEGKSSDEVAVKVEPLEDTKPPQLFVSQPQFKGENVLIEGTVEDDTYIKSVTIQEKVAEVSEQGQFSEEVALTEGLSFIEIIATDMADKATTKKILLEDSQPPKLTIDVWEVQAGKLVISGKAEDDIGLKEIRLDKVPIKTGDGTAWDFSYEAVLNEDAKDVVITVIDLYGNVTEEGPRELTLPEDGVPPTVVSNDIQYGSPIAYISGQVDDPAGIKSVYVQGKAIDIYADGSFKAKVSIEVKAPVITLESPSYNEGKAIVAGKVAGGGFTPSEVSVEAEDLLGNRGVMFTKKVEPYAPKEIHVLVEGLLVDVDAENRFKTEVVLESGKKSVKVEAQDPFENTSLASLDLEANGPLLELQDLEYNKEEESVLISGKAQDTESGLYSLMINSANVDFDEEGNFTYKSSLTESSLVVVATDYIGNVTSLSKEVKPPDIWPPIFAIQIKPNPAIIGNSVNVEISSIDSQTGGPEILKEAPQVTANMDGTAIALQVEGSGSSFIATLDTNGLIPALVEIQVEGEDQAGNASSEVEGTNIFTLLDKDAVNPSFSLEVNPDPMAIGEDAKVKVYASEELKEPPVLNALLPSGDTQVLTLSELSSLEYETTLSIDLDVPMGEVTLTLTGGEDLSGNKHDTTEKKVELAAPEKDTAIPLTIEHVEFLEDKFILKGTTSSAALVHIGMGPDSKDVMADEEGKFMFERFITLEELEAMHGESEVISVKVKARNYAGFESLEMSIDVTLPPLPEEEEGAPQITLQPDRVEQGQILDIMIEVPNIGEEKPQGVISLPDGSRLSVTLEGSVDEGFKGQFVVGEDAPLGSATFQVISGTQSESKDFEIILSSEWMKKLNTADFFNIQVNPDPMVIGQDAEFAVETQGDLDEAPELVVVLPNNQRVTVPLSGSGRNFQGKYTSPEDLLPGRAEIILNPGTQEEVRRPFGVEEEFHMGEEIDVFLTSNPNPLLVGAPFEVKISLSENVDFVPQLFLRLSNGEGIPIPLGGSAPANQFSANMTLPEDAVDGLAAFVLKDEEGTVLDRFSTQVAPAFETVRGVDIFVVPDMLTPSDSGMIQVNATNNFRKKLEAHMSFIDGSKVVVPLETNENTAKGNFTLPETAPFGMISITVFNEDKESLGTAPAEVVEEKTEGGSAHIILENEDFGPQESVRMFVEASRPFYEMPEANFIWDGGSIKIPLKGNIPGNRLEGAFTSPAEDFEMARIEVKDKSGYMLGDFRIEHRPEGEGNIILNPMPPILGQPLTVKVMPPSAINFQPTLRLLFTSAPKELPLYGAIPGDSFSATLNSLDEPLDAIEILDNNGNVLANIPLEVLDNRPPPEWHIEPTSDVIPGESVSLVVRANQDIPFVPRLRLDFQGTIVEVPLNGAPFGQEFFGSFIVPSDADLSNIKILLFDPQGGILWQETVSDDSTQTGDITLNVMPTDDGADLTWGAVRGADSYEIRYGEDQALTLKVSVQGDTQYVFTGLVPGPYSFQVAALDSNGNEIMASRVVFVEVGQTQLPFLVDSRIVGQDIMLSWNEYPLADGYRVEWRNADGTFPPVNINDLQYMLTGLVMGQTYYIKGYALSGGNIISESPEMVHMVQPPPVPGGDIGGDPQVGTDFLINMRFYGDIYFVPQVIVRFDDGSTVLLQATGAGRDFIAILPADQHIKPVMAVDVEDENGNHIMGRPFDEQNSAPPDLQPNPNPPQIGSPVDFTVDLHRIVPGAPSLRLNYEGSSEPVSLQGAVPGSVFTGRLELLNNNLISVDLFDNQGAVRYTWDLTSNPDNSSQQSCTIEVAPEPPAVGLSLDITISCLDALATAPRVFLDFHDGGPTGHMLPTSGQENVFHAILPPDQHQHPLGKIVVRNATGLILAERFFGPAAGSGGEPILNMDPNPPVKGLPATFNVETPRDVPIPPTLTLKFIDGTTESVPLQGTTPGKLFSGTVASLTEYLNDIDLVDAQGTVRYTWPMGSAPDDTHAYSLYIDPEPPKYQQDLNVTLLEENTGMINVNAKIEVEFLNDPSVIYPFGQTAPVTEMNMLIPGSDINDEICAIRAKDEQGQVLAEKYWSCGVVPSPPNSLWDEPNPAPGEINLHWVNVPESAGYKIHFGDASQSYNDPTSPIQVDGGNVNFEIINSLIAGQTYYIVITTLSNSGMESAFSPEFVAVAGSDEPGQGCLIHSPFDLDFNNVVAGSDTETINVTVENKCSTTANVKVNLPSFLENLINNASTIPSSNINVSPTSLTLAGLASGSIAISVSVPSTGLNPGDYIGDIVFYDDVNNNDVKDSDESSTTAFTKLLFGAAGLDISQNDLGLGTYAPGRNTVWGSFTLENTGSINYANIKLIAPSIFNLDGQPVQASGSWQVLQSIPTSITVGGTVTGQICVVIPSGVAAGEYGTMLTFYNDADSDGDIGASEPLETLPVGFTIIGTSTPLAITGLQASDRGTGGTVDLYWTDPNATVQQYHVYHTLSGGAFPNTPNAVVTRPTAQISGLTDGTAYDFEVHAVIGGVEDAGTGLVTKTPTTSGTDITPPTFAGIESAVAIGTTDPSIEVRWGEASDVNTPITYYIDYGISPSSLNVGIATTAPSPYTVSSLSNDTPYYFRVRAEDNLGNREMNNRIESAKTIVAGGGVRTIDIQVASTGTMGTPELVTLTAKDGGSVDANFSDSVRVSVTEQSTRVSNSWLLSVQDRFSGDLAEVDMFNGIGHFTIDSLEPDVLTISTVGIGSSAMQIQFGADSVTSATLSSFAVQGPSTARTNGTTLEGAQIWVSALDVNGQVISDYAGVIDITVTGSATYSPSNNSGSLSGNQYTFAAGDNGEVLFIVKDTTAEQVTFTAASGGKSDAHVVDFFAVNEYLIFSGGTSGISHEALGNRAKFTVYAASSGTRVRGYDATLTWVKQSGDANDSSYASPASISMKDGVAEFYVENSEYEDLTFKVTDGTNISVDTTLAFLSTDTNAPTVINAVAESPYLIHLYFDEEIDSKNALIKANYDVGINIHTVCWYNDNVTIHLDTAMTLGSTQNITVQGSDNGTNGIKDQNGNYISGEQVIPFVVPEVDYQGGAIPGEDWFEVQVSPTTVTPSTPTDIEVTVYHKNACGYLTGSNRVNAKTNDSSASVNYSGSGILNSSTTSVDVSSGVAKFTINVTLIAGQTINISVNSQSVSSQVDAVISAP